MREELATRRIRTRQIGIDQGRQGMSDQNVIPLLHQLKSPTFFTYDVHYWKRSLVHWRYCLVYLDIDPGLTATRIHSFLRHVEFRTWSQRKGKVIRITLDAIRFWQPKEARLQQVPWDQ